MKTKQANLLKLSVTTFVFMAALWVSKPAPTFAARYGESLCANPEYHCITMQPKVMEVEVKTRRGVRKVNKKATDTWETLWPDPRELEIVKKVNRMNITLRPGMTIAVPNNMAGKTYMDYCPYPKKIDPPGEKLMIWDGTLLAWAAYNPDGTLVRWGPAVGGRGYCGDVGRGCRTRMGTFKILSKHGYNCRSGKYPVRKSGNNGGAHMPWFMMFDSRGYGYHGSKNVPGYNASHGCVRLFVEDAEWLNKNFIEIGTKAINRPYE